MIISARPPSLSIFFPCYNDKGTIATLILDAQRVAKTLTDDFEVIVIDDGSQDGSRELLMDVKLKNEVPQFKLIMHEKNKGYGSVLQSGFKTATKEWVFYTDGDGQYDVRELPRLWNKMTPETDIVNGFKIKRHDPLFRIIVGYLYQYIMQWAFWLPVTDVDCDFRLIRRKVFDTVNLASTTGTVTIELVKKVQQAGFRFAEVGVSHHFRTYGRSQFFNFRRILKTLWKLIFLWFELIALHALLRPSVSLLLRKILEGNFRTQKRIIQKHFLPATGEQGKVLDFGCGAGEFSTLFARERYVGIDIDAANVAYAKARYPDKEFKREDGRKLSFADNSFPAALVVGVLHHLDDDNCRRAFSELRRVLRKGGTLIVIEDTVADSLVSRVLRALDRGSHIRNYDVWSRLLTAAFTRTAAWRFTTGVGCPYSGFMLTNEKI